MDLFYYGRRQTVAYDKTAQPIYTFTALTQADFLDPQPGDEFPQSQRHDVAQATLRRIFQHLYRYNPLVMVLSQVKMVWDLADLSQPTPDIAIVANVTDPDTQRVLFDVAIEGVRPRFILEVTSPRFVDADLHDKVTIYAQAGVEEYFILDTGEREGKLTTGYVLIGYRLNEGSYTRIEPDAQGRLWSTTNRVWLGIDTAQDEPFVMDRRTDKRITPDPGIVDSAAAARAEATFRAGSLAEQLDYLRSKE